MSKMTITALLVASTFIASAVNATGFLHQLHQHHAPKMLSSSPKKLMPPEEVVDLSGEWVGTCLDSEGNEIPMSDMPLIIKSDRDSISLSGELHHIGGLDTSSSSFGGTTDFDHSLFQWVEGGTKLLMRYGYVVYFSHGYFDYAIRPSTGDTSFSLKEGRLIVESTEYDRDAVDRTLCTFHKEAS